MSPAKAAGGQPRDPRHAIVSVCHRLYRRGLVTSVAGNVSARFEGGILITRTGSVLGELTLADLVETDLTGGVIGGSAGRPSSELPMHLAIYRVAPAIGAVVHTHSPVATAFSLVGRGLPAVTTEAEMLLGEVPLVPYAPPGSEQLGEAVATFCQTHRAVILERHGVVSWAEDVTKAFHLAELVEETARVCLAAGLLRSWVPVPPFLGAAGREVPEG